MEATKECNIKTSEHISEDPWIFLEKELQEFEKVMKELEIEQGEFSR